METKRTVKKASTKASVNMSKKGKTATAVATIAITAALAKGIKKTKAKGIIAFILCFIIGFGIGFGGYLFLCKDDCFEIVGGDELVLTLDEAYHEQGVKIIEFGRDISDQVQIEMDKNLKLDENGKTTQVGTYYIKYTTNTLKYGIIFKVEKVRLITFVEPSELEEFEGGLI